MAASPVSATLFAYQVGFGDCFLLRFNYADGGRRHALIDFGTTGIPEDAESDLMMQVAKDIKAKVQENDPAGRLDMVVATHRHADHISGFATKNGAGSGDIIRALQPRVVVQPWTELPDAAVDDLGPAAKDALKGFGTRRASLAAMHEVAQSAVQLATRGGLPAAVKDQMAFIGQDNLANLSAVQNLQTMSDQHRYVFHGCDHDLSDFLPGVDITVLGPPTLQQTETIKKQRSRDADEFWQLAPMRFSNAMQTGANRLFPDAPSFPRSKLPTEMRWLASRLEDTSGELMLSLVRALDGQMNNTSVILLMKAGTKSLLFPGDAQLENWQYALQSEYADRLAEVDLLKVGHHGSLNATPKSMWKRLKKRGPANQPGRLTSVMSTMHGKHGSDGKNTEVPRRTLVTALKTESKLYSTEDLDAKDPDGGVTYHQIDIVLT